jgi:two-component system LytT family sensor kinase
LNVPPGAYLAIWTALAVAFAGQSLLYALQAHRPFQAGAALLSSMLYWYLWAVLGLVVLRLADRFPMGGQRIRRHAAVHGLAGVIVAGCHVFLRAAAERALNGSGADGVQVFFVEQFHLDLLVYWGIVGASHVMAFHRQAVARAAEAGGLASRAANLEAMVATARLNALRAQLEPHFLFNTLQAVSTLMRQDVRLADRTLGRLSTLLRRIVDAADVQEVPLHDELQLAGEYLAIQSTRFQTRLAVETHVEPEIENALVPILVMQPLIENACLHGISRRPTGGRVILRAERAWDGAGDARPPAPPGVLRLSVTNDGPESEPSGEPPDGSFPSREGIGLSNTRKRLEALYGDRQTIAMKSRPGGGVEAIVEIPLHWSSADPAGAPRSLKAARG